ncbi:hypothetical protein FOPG_17381 [Fusarium oxysporum f. sp. conglutinans race 2 54008]|uniref:Uncharacterized protein n=1 Tax=Fusarium oxysporum f. sp. conglutinans race 2 54008 TaxID=1089457 RepID=X0HZC0_FUSOX|nr:hypothetical protein FOPG_17381 [Fusarium oxysporum f. sp. conglutinans race 2 54008]
MRAAAAFVDIQLQPRDNEDEGHEGTNNVRRSFTGCDNSPGSSVHYCHDVTLRLDCIPPSPMTQKSVKDNDESRSLGLFNFIRRQRSLRALADPGSKIWWGGESVRSDDEATGRLRIASSDSEFVDHDGQYYSWRTSHSGPEVASTSGPRVSTIEKRGELNLSRALSN